MMKLGCFFCLLLFFFSCARSKPSDDFNTIQVDLTNPQRASLFDYFSHIELIPLETNDDVVIGTMRKVIHHQNRYYVLDAHSAQNVVLVFDDAGKFLFKIGSVGGGPGEYLLLHDIVINPFTDNIDLLCAMRRQIHSYDLQGNYVKSSGQITHDDLFSIWSFVAINEKTYVLLHGSFPFKIFYYDLYEKRVVNREYEESFFANRMKIFNPNNFFYEYLGQWYFYYSTDRTTYKLGPDSLIKAYSWDFGRFNYNTNEIDFPTAHANNWDKITESANQLPYMFLAQGQNDRYVMALIKSNGEIGNLIFDKSTQRSKFIEHFTESVDFRPLVVTNEYVLSFSRHEDIENYVTARMLDETNRRKFEALLNAEEEQNPIIIKYFFR